MTIFNGLKYVIKDGNTKISFLSTLSDVELNENVAIRPLTKIERSTIGKCSTIGTLAAVYDTKIGKFCSIARECYIGGARHPLDRVSTSGCFYLKGNYTGICYYENDFNWRSNTVIGNDVWLGARTMILGGLLYQMVLSLALDQLSQKMLDLMKFGQGIPLNL